MGEDVNVGEGWRVAELGEGEARRYLDPLGNNCDIASVSDGDGALASRSCDGVLFVEDFLELLKCSTNSLDTNEVPDYSLDHVPANEDEHVVVSDVLQSDRPSVCVDEGDLQGSDREDE